MKVLLVSSGSGSRGGGEIFLLYLGKSLVQRGHQVSTWIPAHPRMDELAENASEFGKIIRADYRNTYDYTMRTIATAVNWRVSRHVARHWIELKRDIIHINKQNLEDGLDLLRAAKYSGVPSVCTIHLTQTAEYLRARLAWLRDSISRRALKKYAGVLVAVQETRRNALKQFLNGAVRTETILNGVPLFDLSRRAPIRASKRAELGIPNDALLVVAAARMVPQKRPIYWLDWAMKIRAAVPHAHFLWVGDGSLSREFDTTIAARDLNGVVKHVAWTNDVPSFLQAADVFMHTAEFEGLAFSVLEALSAGLALAVTPNLLAEMPFLNSTNSIRLQDDAGWAEIMCDRDRLAQCGSAARRLAEEQFSFDRMARDYEALYEEMIRDRS